MAPSAKNSVEKPSSVATTGEPQSKKRPIDLVDVEENGDEAEVQVQSKFKKFRKYLEDGGAYESLAKVRPITSILSSTIYILVYTQYPFIRGNYVVKIMTFT